MLLLIPCPAIFFCCDRRSSPFRRFPQITFSDISDFLPSRWRTISPLTYSIKDPCGTHRQAFYFCARMMPVAIARRRQHSTKKGEGKIRKLGNPLCAHKERPPPPPQLRGERDFFTPFVSIIAGSDYTRRGGIVREDLQLLLLSVRRMLLRQKRT